MANGKRSKTRFHTKIAGHPYGIYTWSRLGRGGIVVRIGPLGHIQLQQYRCQIIGDRAAERRGKHGILIHWWGVKGRRRKGGIELAVYL